MLRVKTICCKTWPFWFSHSALILAGNLAHIGVTSLVVGETHLKFSMSHVFPSGQQCSLSAQHTACTDNNGTFSTKDAIKAWYVHIQIHHLNFSSFILHVMLEDVTFNTKSGHFIPLEGDSTPIRPLRIHSTLFHLGTLAFHHHTKL